jgi:choline transport protein
MAIMSTIVIGFVTTFPFIVAMFYCISDFDSVLGTPTGVPIYEIWNQATQSGTAATIFIILLLLTGVFALNASQQTASRLIFSFARDDALVFSNKIGLIHGGLGVPSYALLFNAVVVFIIGCIYLGSSTAFSAIIGTGLVLQQITFAIPAILLMYRRRTPQYLPSSGRFNLGKFGWAVNSITVGWSAFQLVLYNLPLALPVDGVTMSVSNCCIIANPC